MAVLACQGVAGISACTNNFLYILYIRKGVLPSKSRRCPLKDLPTFSRPENTVGIRRAKSRTKHMEEARHLEVAKRIGAHSRGTEATPHAPLSQACST